jgi:hypothetical protein
MAALVLIGGVFGLPAAASANLLVNGDFEAGDVTAGWTDSTRQSFPVPGFPDIFNLQVNKGSDFIFCCGVTGSTANLSNHFAAFGVGNTPNTATLAQHFATTAGTAYQVRFDLGAIGTPGSLQSLNVQVSDVGSASVLATQGYSTTAGLNLDTAFATNTFTFTAIGNQTKLALTDNALLTFSVDEIVDNASVDPVVSAAVPEPAGLFLVGLAGAALCRVRRRRKAA